MKKKYIIFCTTLPGNMLSSLTFNSVHCLKKLILNKFMWIKFIFVVFYWCKYVRTVDTEMWMALILKTISHCFCLCMQRFILPVKSTSAWMIQWRNSTYKWLLSTKFSGSFCKNTPVHLVSILMFGNLTSILAFPVFYSDMFHM
jgi:hypothetical protein